MVYNKSDDKVSEYQQEALRYIEIANKELAEADMILESLEGILETGPKPSALLDLNSGFNSHCGTSHRDSGKD
jgi:hypothetical protein